MPADEHLSSEQFFHGTAAELEEGDVIKPNFGRATFEHEYSREHVYLTPHLGRAKGYAESANYNAGGRDPSKAHVYEVEPLGPIEVDPEYAHLESKDYRTTKARVIKKV